MSQFPTDEVEFGRQWSSCGGEHGALKEIAAMLEGEAGQLYIRGRDETATTVRDLARRVTERAKQSSAKLQGFIDEDRRRNYERTKMLRH